MCIDDAGVDADEFQTCSPLTEHIRQCPYIESISGSVMCSLVPLQVALGLREERERQIHEELSPSCPVSSHSSTNKVKDAASEISFLLSHKPKRPRLICGTL